MASIKTCHTVAHVIQMNLVLVHGYSDAVFKPIIYIMISGGFRLGAWDYLRWKDIDPCVSEDIGHVVAAKVRIYAEDDGEYQTFITSEAYNAVKDWMDFRRYGERIIGDSKLVRNR